MHSITGTKLFMVRSLHVLLPAHSPKFLTDIPVSLAYSTPLNTKRATDAFGNDHALRMLGVFAHLIDEFETHNNLFDYSEHL